MKDRFINKCLNIWNSSSNYQYNARKGYSTQHYLLARVEKWKCLNKKIIFRTLLTDRSKAFHCLLRKRLLAKLNVYSFD